MTNILISGKKYSLLDFETEEVFEKAVIENCKYLFGNDVVYIDIKKRFGKSESYNKGVPDGYLIDFTSNKQPRLYFVENELSTHDVYNHISEQFVRFTTITRTSQNQIRTKLLEVIKSNTALSKEIEKYLKNTDFKNIDELMIFLTENKIKIVLVIDEATTDLNDALDVFRERPDVVTLKRYVNKTDIAYFYEPMREELQEFDGKKTKSKESDIEEIDTIVCPAFEDGFKHAYVEKNAWWAIRLSQRAREQIRYLAMYEKSPVAAIRNYAEIERIDTYKDSGKFILYLKNKKTVSPIELDKGVKGMAPQSPRFTKLSKLLKAKKISELWK